MHFATVVATSLLLLSVVGAPAHSASDGGSDHSDAPVAIGGWRYTKGPNDLHVYVCDQPHCTPGSRVSVVLYPLNPGSRFAMAPGQLRRQEESASEILQEHPKPGTTRSGVKLDLSTGRGSDVATAPDGTKKYSTFRVVTGSNLSATIISSSSDELASEANYLQFEAALKTAVNSGLRAKP